MFQFNRISTINSAPSILALRRRMSQRPQMRMPAWPSGYGLTRPELVKVLPICLGLLLMQAISARAGSITFFDLTDTVTVGLSPDLIARGATSSIVGEVATVTLPAPVFPNGGTSWANTTILEPGTLAVSDTITDNPTVDPNFNILSFQVTFTSDADGGPPLPNLGNTMVEDGTIQEALSSRIRWANGAVVDQIFFQSDAVEVVPEPSTIALLLGSVAGLLGKQRRR